MHKFVLKIVVGALLAGTAVQAYAADLIEEPVEIVPVAAGGWYMRGHIGMSNQYFDQLTSDLYDLPAEFRWLDEGGFAAAPIFGGGIGYQFNDYFRADATIEWRGKSDFDALDYVVWDEEEGPTYTNDYRAKKSELALMANAYWDIATISGITPYVGAGLGASYNRITNFRDNNSLSGGGYADDEGEWNLAWALHAGLGYKVSDRATIDFGYSFISLGDAKTGTLNNYAPELTPPNDGVKFNDIYSHDLKLGFRYAFN